MKVFTVPLVSARNHGLSFDDSTSQILRPIIIVAAPSVFTVPTGVKVM